ncbi:MAG TPA: asparagine synthase (glutamine-hydrolyzing) [Candidatus Methanoperedens sp.]|nr:asparagine synthase (glutamine-hydrolyzing) [Candidatus Methanoperedens sp.]
MCGIVGAWFPEAGAAALEEALRRSAGTLRHRGPDDAGVWCDGRAGIGLAHRRLAILDLSANGHQPMLSASGRFALTYNGEIYNHLEAREVFARAGERFRGHADTETLLASCERLGCAGTLAWINGMYAFALWDGAERVLHLVRDRLGEKPLYYGFVGRALVFASELKAIRAFPGFAAGVDRGALNLFLRYGCIPAPYSIHEGIRKVPPGSAVRFAAADLAAGVLPEPETYWSARAAAARGAAAPLAGTEAAILDELESLLAASVKSRLLSDVPLGAFLSGGVDSSTVVALMQAQSARPVRTFSIGYAERGYDESAHAGRVAAHLGTEHTAFVVEPRDALDVIPRLPAIYDEPFSDPSQIPTCLVAALARRHVTVCLTGDGGDELLAGYNRHVWAGRLTCALRAAPQFLRRAAAALLTLPSPAAWDRLYHAAEPLLPGSLRLELPGAKAHKLAGVLDAASPEALYRALVTHWGDADALVPGTSEPLDHAGRAPLPPETDPLALMQLRDQLCYLPDDILVKVDRASMAVALEVRPPFLDHRLVEHCWRLPPRLKVHRGQGKWALRRILRRHLPPELVERPKMGFGIPIGDWLRGPLRPWAESLLGESRLRQEGFLDPAPIRRAWSEHLSGQVERQYLLWDVLMFQAWFEEQRSEARAA